MPHHTDLPLLQKGTLSSLVHTFLVIAARLDTIILAMNAFPNGTRVFYWGANGEIKYGTVECTSRMADGTQVLVIKQDGGKTTTLPAAGVSIVS